MRKLFGFVKAAMKETGRLLDELDRRGGKMIDDGLKTGRKVFRGVVEGDLRGALGNGLDGVAAQVGHLGATAQELGRSAGNLTRATGEALASAPIPHRFRPIVRTAVLAAGRVGPLGAAMPAADVAAVSAIWAALLVAVAEKSGHPLNGVAAAKVTSSVVTAVGTYLVGSKLANSLLHHAVPAGPLAAAGINTTLNAYATYTLGKGMVELFERPTFDWLDVAQLVKELVGVFHGGFDVSAVADAVHLVKLVVEFV